MDHLDNAHTYKGEQLIFYNRKWKNDNDFLELFLVIIDLIMSQNLTKVKQNCGIIKENLSSLENSCSHLFSCLKSHLEAYSEPCQTFKMQFLLEIVNSF